MTASDRYRSLFDDVAPLEGRPGLSALESRVSAPETNWVGAFVATCFPTSLKKLLEYPALWGRHGAFQGTEGCRLLNAA